jgi:hypothetical protein
MNAQNLNDQIQKAAGGVVGAEGALAVGAAPGAETGAPEEGQAAGKPPGPADKNVCPTAEGCCGKEAAALILRAYQMPVVWDHTSGIVVLHWARQIGKSYALAAWAVWRLMTRPGRLVTVLSNSKENGAEFLLKCAEICRLHNTQFEIDGMPPLDFEDMRMELRFRNRGKMGRIKVLAANPRTARGFSGDLILDEFAFHENAEEIWEAAEPILASNKDFLCRIASTGNGKHNLFYRMVEGEEIKNEDGTQSSKDQGPSSRESQEIKNEKLKVKNSDSENGAGNGAAQQHGPTGGPATDFDFYVEEFEGGVRRVYLPPKPDKSKM